MDLDLKYLRYDIEGKVGILTITNPPVNAFPSELIDEMGRVQSVIDVNEVHVLLIRAEGKYFSAGVDLGNLGAILPENIANRLPRSQHVFSYWQEISIPVIVAVQRLCVGIGMELMLCSDLCVASKGAQFSMPETQFGLAPDMGGTARLTRTVGQRLAKKILLCGEKMDADEMKRIGLVEYVVPEEELGVFSMELAKQLASKPKWAMTFAKKGINAAAEGGLQAGLLFEQAQSVFCCGTEEKNQAVEAFFGKRE